MDAGQQAYDVVGQIAVELDLQNLLGAVVGTDSRQIGIEEIDAGKPRPEL